MCRGSRWFTMAVMLELTDEIVRAAGRHLDGQVGLVEPVAYDVASPTTGALFRLRGAGWSRFVKVVQSFRHWPLLDVFPAELRDRALGGSMWRYEADLYGSDLADVLPPGLRLPEVHGIEDLADDRVAIVLEDVHTDDSAWTLRRFARAARLLGRLERADDRRRGPAGHRMAGAGRADAALLRQPGGARGPAGAA